jgi:hypothetical protein
MKQETIIVKVEKKMKAELKKLADKNNRDFSDFIRRLFQQAIDNNQQV